MNQCCSTLTAIASLSALSFGAAMPAKAASLSDLGTQPAILAGEFPDSPTNRIDPNIPSSPYAGVGSLNLISPELGQAFLCSGTAISPLHVLTAAHCLDVIENDNTFVDLQPENVTFNLHITGDFSHQFSAIDLAVFPDFLGFENTLEHDLAIVTLNEVLPDEVPLYELYRQPVAAGDIFNLVGYGTSGDGINGYTTLANAARKRVGQNRVEDTGFFSFIIPDDIFLLDFDDPDIPTDLLTPFSPLNANDFSLGNELETIAAPGDSGGPSFIQTGNSLALAGVNTFVFAPFSFDRFNQLPEAQQGVFGTFSGGVVVSQSNKLDWIDTYVQTQLEVLLPDEDMGEGAGDDDGGSNGDGGTGGNGSGETSVPEPGAVSGLLLLAIALLGRRWQQRLKG